MKITVTIYDFRKKLRDCDNYSFFTDQAINYIFDYYNDLEEKTGEEIEFCKDDIIKEWNEVDRTEIPSRYRCADKNISKCKHIDDVIELLSYKTEVIKVDGTNNYLIRNF